VTQSISGSKVSDVGSVCTPQHQFNDRINIIETSNITNA